jgi:transposase
VDSSSIAVNRRHRRAQTARLAVPKLLTRLRRYGAGETRVWSSVRVPRIEEEDRRQLQHALATAKRDRTRVINRLQGLLASPGLVMPPSGDFQPQLEALRRWDGAPLPAGLRPRLGQAWEHGQGLAQRIGQWAAERRVLMQTAEDAAMKKVRPRLALQGIGSKRAWVLVMECFGGRACRNGTEVGALSG